RSATEGSRRSRGRLVNVLICRESLAAEGASIRREPARRFVFFCRSAPVCSTRGIGGHNLTLGWPRWAVRVGRDAVRDRGIPELGQCKGERAAVVPGYGRNFVATG